jgi:hypothetical protein
VELSQWLSAYPLPKDWAVIEDCQVPFNKAGVSLHLTGLVAQNKLGQHALGSAASATYADSMPRAFFELLERLSIVEAENSPDLQYSALNEKGEQIGVRPSLDVMIPKLKSDLWVLSRSNGVAAGPDFQSARRSAELELVERDRLIRSWYGEVGVQEISRLALPVYPAEFARKYDFSVFQFESLESIEVVGAFGFPRTTELPLLFGFGAGGSVSDALKRAVREIDQRMGFLMEEPLPPTCPEIALSPAFNQDYFLYPPHHRLIRDWLDGKHFTREPIGPQADLSLTEWIDITPMQWSEKLRVIKSINATLAPLTFGKGHPWVTPGRYDIHPFC